MATQHSSLINLRVITQRLAFTPAWQLPNIVVHLASSLPTCKAILATSDLRPRNDGSDAAILVHKFKTQLSALLQDKSPEARWSAIVLIKATVEVGGWEVQRGCGVWVRGLLGVLSKTDPPTTKQLCIITLTRIFQLIEEYQVLVREITTPSLPGFITSCLNLSKSWPAPLINISCYETTLSTILQSFCTLIPHHPTLFRPFLTQIRSLIIPFLAATPSSIVVDEDVDQRPSADGTHVAHSSRRLFALLSNCAPKNNSAEEWAESVHSIIKSLHRTADRAFRAVVEDWEPSLSNIPVRGNLLYDFSAVVCSLDEDGLELPAWRGIYAGIERIDGLLQTLKVFLTAPTKLSVKIPVGAFIDVTERILSITLPLGEGESEYDVTTFNPEGGKEERDGLWAGLPMIHVAALEVLSQLILRLGRGSAIACHVILERALSIFEAERGNHNIRATVYRLVSDILQLVGWSLPKSIVSPLSKCVKNCCEDLVPSKGQVMPADNSAASLPRQPGNSASINANSHSRFPTTSANLSENSKMVETAAGLLLSVSVSHVPRDFFTYILRAQIDRTAILIKSKPTMLASVLNPPTRRKGAKEPSSIMPLLARGFPSSLEVEILVQPRMPIMKPQRDDIGETVSYLNVSEGLEQQALEHEKKSEAPRPQVMNDSLPQEKIEFHEKLTPGVTETRAISETKSNASSPKVPDIATYINSQKRDRDSGPNTDDLPQAPDPDFLYNNSSSELNGPPKRARLEFDSSDMGERTKSFGIEPALFERESSLGSKEPATVAQKGAAWTPSAAKSVQELDTSNESDFEMPVIDLESDTSLEDAEGE